MSAKIERIESYNAHGHPILELALDGKIIDRINLYEAYLRAAIKPLHDAGAKISLRSGEEFLC